MIGNFKKWWDPSNGGDDFEMGGWYPFTDYDDPHTLESWIIRGVGIIGGLE